LVGSNLWRGITCPARTTGFYIPRKGSEKLPWGEWPKAPNPYAEGDIPMMEAGGWKYFSLVQIMARKL
jgi:hypothetical protein